MAIPTDTGSALLQRATLLNPDNIEYNPFFVYERGGVDLQDATEGNTGYIWQGYYSNNSIKISQGVTKQHTIVSNVPNVVSLDIAFDQNMNVLVTYQIDTTCYLYWFDSAVQGYVTSSFPNARSPRLTLDDKRATSSSSSDVLFAYIKSNGSLVYRQQRDRFTVERVLNTGIPDEIIIEKIGMAENNRVLFQLSPYRIMPTCNLNNIVENL